MPSYNDARELFGLDTISDWSDLTTNKFYQRALTNAYDSVDELDAVLGAFIETVEAGISTTSSGSGHVGSLFANILNEQFLRTYTGDRLFYRWNDTLVDYVEEIYLSDLIYWNANIENTTVGTFTFSSAANAVSGSELLDDGFNTILLLNDKYQLFWKVTQDGDALKSEGIDDYLEIKVSVEISGSSDEGFIGIGYGDTEYMNDKDITKLVYIRNGESDEFICMDTFSTDWKPELDSHEDIYDCSASIIDNIVTFEFKRPLTAFDDEDNEIPIDGTISYFIAAYNDESTEAKHATNKRTPGQIDWLGGTATSVDNTDTIALVRLYHGLTMIALFIFAYPVSAFVARYLRHYPWWREAHKMVGSLGVMSCITSAYVAISTVSDRTRISRPHNSLGLTCVILLCLQVFGGYATNFWLLNRSRGKEYRYIHYGHLLCAVCILFISPWTCYEGWMSLLPDDIPALETPVTWYLMIFTLLASGEAFRKFYHYCTNDGALEVFQTNFHVFTWDQIGEKVSAGAAWLVIGKYVYDVTSWQTSHPGGRRILLDYIGTDCTEMFYGRSPVGETHGGITYQHSARAIKQMTQMVVGEIPLEETNEYLSKKRENGGKLPDTEEMNTIDGAVGRRRTGSLARKNNLNVFTDRNFRKYADLYENAPLARDVKKQKSIDKNKRRKSKNKGKMSDDIKKNMELTVGQLSSFGKDQDDSAMDESNDPNASDIEEDSDFSNSNTFDSLLEQLMHELNEERANISHVKSEISISVTTPSANSMTGNSNFGNTLVPNTSLQAMESNSVEMDDRNGGAGVSRSGIHLTTDEASLANEMKENGNTNQAPASPDSMSSTPTKLKRIFTSSSLHPQASRRSRAGTLETLKLEEQRYKRAKRFRAIKLVYKCKLTHEQSHRPIMLLEWDMSNVDSKLNLDSLPGEYLLLHHIDKDTISRAYTPVPSHFVLCNNEKFIHEQENKHLNRKMRKLKDSKISIKDRYKRIFLMVRLYPRGRMSKVLKSLKPGTELRLTGPFVRQKVLPRFGRDYGYGDRCWRHLVMIAGGTGFTPMLDALMHHLEYGTDEVKLLFVWFNRKPIDLCCMEQFEWFVTNYPNRFYVNLVFSERAEDPVAQEIVKLWGQRVASCIYYNKWNAEECVEVISKFFKQGKVTDVRIADPVAVSVPIGIDKNAKKVGLSAANNDNTQVSGENENENDQESKYSLNKHDRIILSGPKLFVEKFLTWIRDGKAFAGTNIGKQIICYD